MKIVKKFCSNHKMIPLRILDDREVKALFWVLMKGQGSQAQKDIAIRMAEWIRDLK